MKQLLLLLAVAVAFSSHSAAQTGGSDTRTPATGAEDMSTWTKGAKSPTQKERQTQTGQNAAQPGSATSGAKAGPAALTGCLAADQADGKFMLTSARDKTVEVTPDAGVDLKPHVGHKVRLTGNWKKAEGAGEKETAQGKPGGRTFTAAKVDHLATECKAPAGARKERAGP